MPNSLGKTTSLKTLADCIKRDPAGWNGVSLLYQRPCDKQAVQDITKRQPDVLALYGSRDDCLLLGVGKPQAPLMENASACFWIPDIAMEWAQAYGIIHTMTSQAEAAPAVKSVSPAHAKSPSILIVEDDPMTSKMVEQQLKKFGSVITTRNSRQATANYNVKRPDLVFLDIHYQDDLHDGFDVLKNLLSMDANAFVVMVSGNRDPATILKALSLGAQGFIAKPFRAEDFAHYLAKFSDR